MFNKASDFKKHCEAAATLVEALPTLFDEVGGGGKDRGPTLTW